MAKNDDDARNADKAIADRAAERREKYDGGFAPLDERLSAVERRLTVLEFALSKYYAADIAAVSAAITKKEQTDGTDKPAATDTVLAAG